MPRRPTATGRRLREFCHPEASTAASPQRCSARSFEGGAEGSSLVLRSPSPGSSSGPPTLTSAWRASASRTSRSPRAPPSASPSPQHSRSASATRTTTASTSISANASATFVASPSTGPTASSTRRRPRRYETF